MRKRLVVRREVLTELTAEEARAVADLNDLPRACLDREAAFLADLGLFADSHRSAMCHHPRSWEQLRLSFNPDAAAVRCLQNDVWPEDDAGLQLHIGRDQHRGRVGQQDVAAGEGGGLPE